MERMVRLKAPKGVTSVEYGGEEFAVKNGHVLVPIGAEMALTRQDYGFTFPDDPVLHFMRPAAPAPVQAPNTLHLKRR